MEWLHSQEGLYSQIVYNKLTFKNQVFYVTRECENLCRKNSKSKWRIGSNKQIVQNKYVSETYKN